MLELKNVVKEYDGKKVLKGISYTFIPGKVYFILGESGSGKTTLLKLILGLDNKYDGYIIYKINSGEQHSRMIFRLIKRIHGFIIMLVKTR